MMPRYERRDRKSKARIPQLPSRSYEPQIENYKAVVALEKRTVEEAKANS
jgi:hypothetical protein